jgi:hypothetical protein
MKDLKEWLAERSERDQELYERYGKPLQTDHAGKYVAIGPDGHTIVDTDSAEVLRQAIAKFGSGNFALKRVGHRAFDTWLTVSR